MTIDWASFPRPPRGPRAGAGRRAALERALRTAIRDGRLDPASACRRPAASPATWASRAAPSPRPTPSSPRRDTCGRAPARRRGSRPAWRRRRAAAARPGRPGSRPAPATTTRPRASTCVGVPDVGLSARGLAGGAAAGAGRGPRPRASTTAIRAAALSCAPHWPRISAGPGESSPTRPTSSSAPASCRRSASLCRACPRCSRSRWRIHGCPTTARWSPTRACGSPLAVDEHGALSDLSAARRGRAAHPGPPVPARRHAAPQRRRRVGWARDVEPRRRGRLRRRVPLRPAAGRARCRASARSTSSTPAPRARPSRPACGSDGSCSRRASSTPSSRPSACSATRRCSSRSRWPSSSAPARWTATSAACASATGAGATRSSTCSAPARRASRRAASRRACTSSSTSRPPVSARIGSWRARPSAPSASWRCARSGTPARPGRRRRGRRVRGGAGAPYGQALAVLGDVLAAG